MARQAAASDESSSLLLSCHCFLTFSYLFHCVRFQHRAADDLLMLYAILATNKHELLTLAIQCPSKNRQGDLVEENDRWVPNSGPYEISQAYNCGRKNDHHCPGFQLPSDTHCDNDSKHVPKSFCRNDRREWAQCCVEPETR